jgi:hypothetical protein
VCEERLQAARLVGRLQRERPERTLEVDHRVAVRGQRGGGAPRAHGVVERLRAGAERRRVEVVDRQRRIGRRRLRMRRFERHRDAPVQLGARRGAELAVEHLADERVREAERARRVVLLDDAERGRRVDPCEHRLGGLLRRALEQPDVELAPDDGGQAEQRARIVRQRIEPPADRRAETVRQRHAGRCLARTVVGEAAQDLLQEERVAFR